MYKSVFAGALSLCGCVVSAAPFVVEYDGSIAPDQNDPPLAIETTGGSSWNVDGGSLNLTVVSRGSVGFGVLSTSHPWLPSTGDLGNYMSFDIRHTGDTSSWSASLSVGQHSGLFVISRDGFVYNFAGGSTSVDMDLTTGFHTFEILLRDGLVSYRVNGEVLADRVDNFGNLGTIFPIAGISSNAGVGTISIDNFTFIGSPGFTVIPTPGVAATLGLAGLVACRRRR